MKSAETCGGIFWMVLAQAFFLIVWCSVKYLGKRIPVFEVMFFRSALSLAILMPLTLWRQKTLRGSNLGMLAMRSVSGFLAMACSFYAVIHARLANASTLMNTLPIFVALMAPLLLKEKLIKRQFIFIALSFLGIVIMFRPDAHIFDDASIYALIGGALAAHAMICIRRLHDTDSTLIIAFYFSLVSTVLSIPFAVANYVAPTSGEWAWLIVIGVGVTFGQIFLTRSYKCGRASTVAPFSYVSVIGSFVAGTLLFGEIPDAWSIAGAAVIIAGGVGVLVTSPKRIEEELSIA